nr:zinc finger, CCHC-type [Tanacetum cinerariifolium]
MKSNESANEFAGKLSSIQTMFKSLRGTLKDKVLVRKLVPKKFLPIVASIEQYQEIDTMQFEEAVGRITAFEERLKIKTNQKTIIKTNFYWQVQIIKEVAEDMKETSPKTKVAMKKCHNSTGSMLYSCFKLLDDLRVPKSSSISCAGGDPLGAHNEVKKMPHHFGREESGLEREIVEGWIDFLNNINALIPFFRTVQNKMSEVDIPEYQLFQQYVVVIAYCAIEQSRTDFLRAKQNEIRNDFLSTLYYAITRGDQDGRDAGSRIILPVTFTGAPRPRTPTLGQIFAPTKSHLATSQQECLEMDITEVNML